MAGELTANRQQLAVEIRQFIQGEPGEQKNSRPRPSVPFENSIRASLVTVQFQVAVPRGCVAGRASTAGSTRAHPRPNVPTVPFTRARRRNIRSNGQHLEEQSPNRCGLPSASSCSGSTAANRSHATSRTR